jgi:hypothetical protein
MRGLTSGEVSKAAKLKIPEGIRQLPVGIALGPTRLRRANMKGLMTFFAGVLSVIAVGVLLIAYSLLSPRLASADGITIQRPMYAADRFSTDSMDSQSLYASRQIAYPVSDAAAADVRAVRAVNTYDAPRRISRPVSYQPRSTRIERAPSRDWTRTAMIIGGSTAAGAGLGGIFGGKKGALIGAALGGGAATIYEVKNR